MGAVVPGWPILTGLIVLVGGKMVFVIGVTGVFGGTLCLVGGCIVVAVLVVIRGIVVLPACIIPAFELLARLLKLGLLLKAVKGAVFPEGKLVMVGVVLYVGGGGTLERVTRLTVGVLLPGSVGVSGGGVLNLSLGLKNLIGARVVVVVVVVVVCCEGMPMFGGNCD